MTAVELLASVAGFFFGLGLAWLFALCLGYLIYRWFFCSTSIDFLTYVYSLGFYRLRPILWFLVGVLLGLLLIVLGYYF